MKHETRPTPETDAVSDKAYNFLNDGDIEAVEAEFARKLERERDQLREAIQEAHDALQSLIAAKRGGMQPANMLIDATSRANNAVKKLKPLLQ